ncbi:NADH dehydrogenase-like protein [Planctomycetes bacterium Pan216]|uniref:NADH:ubiquinone reductase (non-electrogenic) n=1 Tax=Kolteria novifilia TaxID=2527975 RepID=A0A518AY28_9BACT|nr:NADH dehydrogenase-like protein [Planctomycetes bacterium Pan216]
MAYKRVVILGGGFAGVYTAMYLERHLHGCSDVEIVLINNENYLVFQPMLPEVISGNMGILDTVSPIRRLCPRTKLYVRRVEDVDVVNKTVVLSPGFRPRSLTIKYDHLVVALGNVTDFRGMSGLHDHAMPFKTLADALRLRDHLIHVLAEADIETDPELKEQLLTFVVAGGGFSGVECCAEMADFVRRAARSYHRIKASDIRCVLVHSRERILNREMPESLGLYGQKILTKRGVELQLNHRLKAASPEFAVLDDGTRIPTKTLVSTVPSSPNPVVENMDVPKVKGRIISDLEMQVQGFEDVWALGDCALVPSPTGEGYCPPTAQFAIRQAKTCADNIMASFGRNKGKRKQFKFKELGKMAQLGHRTAIAQLFGWLNLHGFFAWVFWRAIYWVKLPGLDRKIKVGASWFLDLLVPPELVQTKLDVPSAMTHEHYEPGEIVFREGDLGDRLYIIVNGEAEVYHDTGQGGAPVARLGAGEVFGEFSLLENKSRSASVRCVDAMDVITIAKSEFGPLVTYLPSLRQSFESMMQTRLDGNGTPSESSQSHE